MTDVPTQIAAGLERAFAQHGFAEPNIETLRKAAGVSLRTLYKYMPSREEMVLQALEHRHQRFMAFVFPENPATKILTLASIIDRVADWMRTEAAHGCLFHAAVAAAPQDERLRSLLARHKHEMARKCAQACDLQDKDVEITLVVEGLMQSWPLLGDRSVIAAKRLSALLA